MEHLETALKELLVTSPNNPRPKGSHAPLNHGAMAIETLETLGYQSTIPRWMDEYRPQLGPKPPRVKPIGSNWQEELGRPERYADWEDYFKQELQTTPWKKVLSVWLLRLFPGILAEGGHGLIRVAHATRSLERKETEVRKSEFAQALAMWAAFYLELVDFKGNPGTSDLAAAISRLPILGPNVDRAGVPPLVEKRLLEKNQDFDDAVMSLKITDDTSNSIHKLTEFGARIYLANADYFPLIFLHGVTEPAALLLVLPYLESEYYKRAFFYVWQVFAASISAYGVTLELQDLQSGKGSPQDTVERAVSTLDEHAIKLVEACIREEKQNRTSVYAAAIEDWVSRLEKSARWTDQKKAEAGLAIQSKE